MVLSRAPSDTDVSVHSTFASRYVRASLPRHVPYAGELDPQGGGVPDHQRRADAGRQPAPEPGLLRHHLDGARVRQAHHGLHQQELRRHGRVPGHHRAPEPVREHDRASLPRAAGRVRDGRGRRHGGVVGGHHAGRPGLQEEVAEQAQDRGQALRQAQHHHGRQRPSKIHGTETCCSLKFLTEPCLLVVLLAQVCWEKFARYFEVELKEVKLREGYYVMDPEQAVEMVDENTICVAAILGSTLNGEFEDVKRINDLLEKKNKETGWDTPIHVDAASGGFIAPFLYPELEWDFRLPWVKSINVSGHKYGLVYAGIGWCVWRNKEDLPDELIFHINYLGADQPTFTLNFSKGSSQVIAQYYQLIRHGFEGYRNIMENCHENAMVLKEGLEKTGRFNIVSKDEGVPLVAFSLKDHSRHDEFEISDMLRRFGWIVPAYTMPPDAQHVTVLRVVIREEFSRTLAERLVLDIDKVMSQLDALPSSKLAPPPALLPAATLPTKTVVVANGHVKKTELETQKSVTDAWKKFVLAKKTNGVC